MKCINVIIVYFQSPNKDLEYSLTLAPANAGCRSLFGVTRNGGLYVHTDLVGNQTKQNRYNVSEKLSLIFRMSEINFCITFLRQSNFA